MGLWTARRGVQEQRQGCVAQEVRAGKPVQCWFGCGDPDESDHVGRVGPCWRFFRSADGLQGVQGALPCR